MRATLNKDKCSAIDAAFTILKNDTHNIDAVKIIKDTLENSFNGYTFDVSITDTSFKNDGELFIMSIYPEMSTIDKIISAVLENKEDSVIKKLWETNKKWTIEIDDKFLKGEYVEVSNTELTATLLHEIGHVIYSNSIHSRISSIFRYEITKSSFVNKALIKGDKIFRTILSLPILDVCISDTKKDFKSVKEEIKADGFVKKVGYTKELESILTKLINYKGRRTPALIGDKLKKSTDFSLKTIEDFRLRRDNLAKNNLLSLKENCVSPYICNIIDSYISTVFEDAKSGSLVDGRKNEYMHERADKVIQDEYICEFFSFGKQLKRIDPNDLDYAEIKVQGIKNENDKLMVASYINSKLDLVDYYISLMENPKTAKKYIIPHSLDTLYQIKKRLLVMRDNAIKFKIPERNKKLFIQWPEGYEG